MSGNDSYASECLQGPCHEGEAPFLQELKNNNDMTVCIAEKPSVAQDIARVIGANRRCEGYFEGNGFQVTWTFGHLCRLKTPEEYDDGWKRWSLESLPMVPEQFGIHLLEGAHVKKQFKVIKTLFSKADCIVNCGDAGQEGELIQRWVMELAGVKCPVKRLWISSLTEESIREGFLHLRKQSEYDRLYQAGVARASGDWLLGMNATRLYTLRYGGSGTVLSVGRVQTPTLALIVNRQREIDHFIPEPYWLLTTRYRETVFHATAGAFKNKEEGGKALAAITGKPFVIDGIIRKRGSEAPPQLYDLTALQVDCNRRFGFSADMTLRTIQSLYEKKLTTYPRVDTRYLSDDIYPKCQGILDSLIAVYPQWSGIVQQPLRKDRRVFDSGKVTDHHAIIPTGRKAQELLENEAKVYDLIARRFAAVFCGDCQYLTTTVKAHSEEIAFKTTGREILSPGWKAVYAGMAEKEDDGEDDEKDEEGKKKEKTAAVLPHFDEGETGAHTPSLVEKQTTPPKQYTEATLLQTMETAGKLVDDEEIRAALKQNGIGRPSSRASIIETLFKRGYVRRNRKTLVPTPTGQSLIGTIRSDLLKSCELTGQWERKLRLIEEGRYEPETFMEELKQQLAAVISDVKSDTASGRVCPSEKPRKPYKSRKSRKR